MVEAEDDETRAALARTRLPTFVEVVVAPPGEPRTKPRALNIALELARGAFTTVYDAEDVPHPNQLRLAVATFAAAGPEVAGCQARLAIDNTEDGWLTRFFTSVLWRWLERELALRGGRGGLPPFQKGAAMAARGLAIRADVATPTELRRLAKREPRRRTAQRLLAIANAIEGMSRADAAKAAGIERQALRDAVVRFNAEGLSGLVDRPYGRRPERLTEGEQTALVNRVLRGPDPERGEPSSWTLPDLCRFVGERFGKTMRPQSMSRVVRRLGLSRQKARPVHPQRDARAAEAFAKRGSPLP